MGCYGMIERRTYKKRLTDGVHIEYGKNTAGKLPMLLR